MKKILLQSYCWGDETFDWHGLSDAICLIWWITHKIGRFGGQIKEKWSFIRFYSNLGYLSLHTLIYPGYAFSRFPNWLWHLDCEYIAPVLQFLFGKLFVMWQLLWFNIAIELATRKWPHLRHHIVMHLDHCEALWCYKRLKSELDLSQDEET